MIVARYKAGESAKALGQEYGVSRDGITRLLKHAGIPIRTQLVVTYEVAHHIVERYEGGLTIREVAVEVGCANSTARGVLHENGVEVRVSPVGKRKRME